MCLFLARSSALFEVPAESDGEPEENLTEGNNAESQTEAEESTEVGDEVKDCHPLGDLVLCRNQSEKKISNDILHFLMICKISTFLNQYSKSWVFKLSSVFLLQRYI